MSDYIDYSRELPLSRDWERAGIKQIAEINHLLCHGVFSSPVDLAQRLGRAARDLVMTYAGVDGETALSEATPTLPDFPIDDRVPVAYIGTKPIYGVEDLPGVEEEECSKSV